MESVLAKWERFACLDGGVLGEGYLSIQDDISERLHGIQVFDGGPRFVIRVYLLHNKYCWGVRGGAGLANVGQRGEYSTHRVC